MKRFLSKLWVFLGLKFSEVVGGTWTLLRDNAYKIAIPIFAVIVFCVLALGVGWVSLEVPWVNNILKPELLQPMSLAPYIKGLFAIGMAFILIGYSH